MKAVILAGGSGTRLWPLSRLAKPKQFQALAGTRTLYQSAWDRLNFLKPSDILVATNEAFVEEVQRQTPELPTENLLIEPALRDTASCIGLAAAVIAKHHPDEVMAVLYADHLIQGTAEFQKKLRVAEQIAQAENTLNILEVTAKTPNVNLGYVKVGAPLKTLEGVEIRAFERFVEKPDLATAENFVKDEHYLWNTGIYVWKVSTILEAYRKHLPDTHERLMKIQAAWGTPGQTAIVAQEYPACQKISIDYAIMEKVAPNDVRILPADLGWSDIGTWESLHEELAPTSADTVEQGETLTHESSGCLIHNAEPKKLIVALGLKDVVIVNTPDAILVADKHQSQQLKQVIEMLKAKGREDLL